MATFGDTTVGGDTKNVAADEAIVGKFTLSELGNVSSISIHCRTSSGTGNIKGLIYADSAGTPGSRLAVGAVVGITTSAGWAVSTLTVQLAAGDYWIGCVSDVAIIVSEDSLGGAQTALKTSFTYASPADPFGSETSNDDGFQINCYGTYEVPTTGVPVFYLRG